MTNNVPDFCTLLGKEKVPHCAENHQNIILNNLLLLN